MARSTLEMALEAAGVGAGDEVIVPAISFVATASAVSRRGALPVFVDIDDTFNVDPECVQRAVTDETAAIMAVHFGGPMADMDRLLTIARDAGAYLIEDARACARLGVEWPACGQHRPGGIVQLSEFEGDDGGRRGRADVE